METGAFTIEVSDASWRPYQLAAATGLSATEIQCSSAEVPIRAMCCCARRDIDVEWLFPSAPANPYRIYRDTRSSILASPRPDRTLRCRAISTRAWCGSATTSITTCAESAAASPDREERRQWGISCPPLDRLEPAVEPWPAADLGAVAQLPVDHGVEAVE